MSRSRLQHTRWLLGVVLLCIAASIRAQEVRPQPTINMLGFENSDTQIEWIVTVGNVGDEPTRNVVIADTLPDNLSVDTVQITTGTASVNQQTVTVLLPELAAGETIQFSIITTRLNNASPVNTACITADDASATSCVRAMAVHSLPETGETPLWRSPFLQLSLLTVSVSLLLIGMGLFGWQVFAPEEE